MNKIFFVIAALLAAAAVLASCASSAKPAAGGGVMSLDEAIAEAAVRIDERIEAGSKIALFNFNSPSDIFSAYVLDELTANLLDSRKLVVVDRNEISLIRREFEFQFSGDVADGSMQELGQMLGAQSIVSGSLTEIGRSYRIVVRVLDVQTAAVAAQYRTDIARDERVLALLRGGRLGGTGTAVASGGNGAAASGGGPANDGGSVNDIGPANDGEPAAQVSTQQAPPPVASAAPPPQQSPPPQQQSSPPASRLIWGMGARTASQQSQTQSSQPSGSQPSQPPPSQPSGSSQPSQPPPSQQSSQSQPNQMSVFRRLATEKASVFLATVPPQADIYIGDKFIGKSNGGELQVPIGTHQVKFVKGGAEKVVPMTFQPGKNPTKIIQLK